MLHRGRCGSTVIGNLLNQHPKIFWDGEIYKNYIESWQALAQEKPMVAHSKPLEVLQRSMGIAGRNFYGFEAKFTHIEAAGIGMEEYLQRIDRAHVGNIIFLNRKNYLRQITSSLILKKTSCSFKTAKEKRELVRVEVDIDHTLFSRQIKPLMSHMEQFKREDEYVLDLLGRRRFLNLSYEEDILQDPLVAYERVCDHLGLEKSKVMVKHS